MNRFLIFHCGSFLIVSVLVGCKHSSTEILTPEPNPELVQNTSFEYNGAPSLSGWHTPDLVDGSPDTSRINFSANVPSGGGAFSVGLLNDWFVPAQIYTTMGLVEGSHQYRFSLWLRYPPEAYAGAPRVDIFVHDVGGTWQQRRDLSHRDSLWTEIGYIDTLNSAEFDSVAITLHGAQAQFAFNFTYYDLCTFTLLQ